MHVDVYMYGNFYERGPLASCFVVWPRLGMRLILRNTFPVWGYEKLGIKVRFRFPILVQCGAKMIDVHTI